MANLGAVAGDIGAGVSDLFQASADRSKQQYDLLEGQEYTDAATLATQNEQFTQQSTAIKEAQESRAISKSLGQTTSQIAGAGFATSGSGLDILRDSASQGALTKAVASENGLIQETSYQQQADSYKLMATAADNAASAEGKAAGGADIAAIIKFASANWA